MEIDRIEFFNYKYNNSDMYSSYNNENNVVERITEYQKKKGYNEIKQIAPSENGVYVIFK